LFAYIFKLKPLENQEEVALLAAKIPVKEFDPKAKKIKVKEEEIKEANSEEDKARVNELLDYFQGNFSDFMLNYLRSGDSERRGQYCGV